jgi:hypothetical protein
MYQQRVDVAPDSVKPLEKLWAPRYIKSDGTEKALKTERGDKYAVVDEIIDDQARVVIATWPKVDRDGRLHFPGKWRVSRPIFSLEALTQDLNRGRAASAQPERELRVGDTFWARAKGKDRWAFVIDVTGETRTAAKAAQLRAVAPPAVAVAIAVAGPARPSPRKARRRMIRPALARPEAEPRPGSVAQPVI